VIRRFALFTAAALLAAPALAGCSSTSTDGKLKAVVGFYPLEFLVQQIGGSHFDVENLTIPGVEPENMTLTVRQTADVVGADVVVYLKGFQAPVDDAVAQSDSQHIVDVGPAVDLVPFQENPSEMNPHFWLDPVRYSQAASAVEQGLAAADPAHAADYEANLAALQGRLADLNTQYKNGLENCQRNVVIVSHDAFAYMGSRYGFTSYAINGLSPDAEPSPAHIAQLHDLIQQYGITTAFAEPLTSSAMADSLAQDLGISVGVLDPIGGLESGNTADDYFTIMERNLSTLEQANGCQ
jgi:zinc transport system substrate-binding protein